jgi:hypothetical protein
MLIKTGTPYKPPHHLSSLEDTKSLFRNRLQENLSASKKKGKTWRTNQITATTNSVLGGSNFIKMTDMGTEIKSSGKALFIRPSHTPEKTVTFT